MLVVRSAPVRSLNLLVHVAEQQRPVRQQAHIRQRGRVERSLVLRPRDELEGRIGLDVASDHTGLAQRQELDRGRVGDARRVCQETKTW